MKALLWLLLAAPVRLGYNSPVYEVAFGPMSWVSCECGQDVCLSDRTQAPFVGITLQRKDCILVFIGVPVFRIACQPPVNGWPVSLPSWARSR